MRTWLEKAVAILSYRLKGFSNLWRESKDDQIRVQGLPYLKRRETQEHPSTPLEGQAFELRSGCLVFLVCPTNTRHPERRERFLRPQSKDAHDVFGNKENRQ